MKKLKLYLDTSIINWAVSDDPKRAEEKEETLKVIEKINNGEYEGYISELVIAEINKTPDEKHRETLQKYLNEIDVNVIAESEESDELANKYVKEDIIPQKHYNDAVHIALASINNDKTTLILTNYDGSGRNTEAIPVIFKNLTPGKYNLTKTYLNGQKETNLNIEAVNREINLIGEKSIIMTANSIVELQLTKIN